jgi:peroxiredoxin
MTPLTLSLLLLAAEPAPGKGEIGKPVADFALADVVTGKTVKLSDFAGKTVVIGFQGVQCAMVDRHQDRIAALVADYAGRGVVFLAVNSNSDETAEDARRYVEKNKLTYPTLKDPGHKAADYFAATHTPAFRVIDGKGVWRYSGAFDDNPFPDAVKVRYVRDALDAVLAGKDPPVARTKEYGCRIARNR